MKYIITSFLLLLFIINGNTQNVKETTHREVNIHERDSSIKASILVKEKKIKPNIISQYYWYYNNSIKTNQGGYKGHLLDGEYLVMAPKGDLLTKGDFKKGIKSGEWRRWDKDGFLLSVNNWKNGYKSGKEQQFKKGMLVAQYNFKRNQLDGNYKKFENTKLTETGSYKNGVLLSLIHI